VMRIFLLGLLYAIGVPLLEAEDRLKVEITRLEGTKDRMLLVILTNISKEPFRLFEDRNSWGYRQLSFSATLQDGTQIELTRGPYEWTRNFPSTTLLQPGQTYAVAPGTFSEANWRGFAKVDGCHDARLKAKYTSRGEEALERGEMRERYGAKRGALWSGTAESEPIRIDL
jgi:hypothetical protein